MKKLLNKVFILLNVAILLNCLLFPSISADIISDPGFLEAVNNNIRKKGINRGDRQQISDKDIKYVDRLDAGNMQISDISGLEQFVNIRSIIDLSNNNIKDITPLIKWVKNKDSDKLNVDIFLGGNSLLLKNNYEQIYTLSGLGDYIRIYDSQRMGEGVFELQNFYNGKPVKDIEFDVVASSNRSNKSEIDRKDNIINRKDNIIDLKNINTGKEQLLIYILSCIMVLFILCVLFYKEKRNIKKQSKF